MIFYQCLALILIADGKLSVTAIIMIAPPPNTKANANTSINNDDNFGSNMLTIQSTSNKYQKILIGSGECILQNTNEQHCGFFTLSALPIDPTILFYDWYNSTQSSFQQSHIYLQTFYSTYILDMLTIQKHKIIPTLGSTHCHKMRILQTKSSSSSESRSNSNAL